ncbi:hypothetical protein DTO021D3_7049 [Paecilomyces variotii]|nr:hypothetical protein DTO032I3_3885 [Paecilomyces variotii]KAJ9276144.1 hypothetical protein DTO021D3_7049 [Paecilomyces variotii]KAJ9340213.1 hypothetical protein DTO027B6_7284 [Paecilomyces variotii]KAJ9377528.1 hypothetical protein DTO032I4_8067 [Paecilomyces variotii]KAJ9405710.1 hypothetical protein DTO045G8_6543 [Paecilomyces variotii]
MKGRGVSAGFRSARNQKGDGRSGERGVVGLEGERVEGELVGGKLADALLALVEVSGAGGGERRQSDRPVSTGNRPNTKLREYCI